MPQTPDRFPGERQEEGILFDVGSDHPTVNGEMRYVTGAGFRVFEEGIEHGLANDSNVVHKTGTEIVDGAKTFSDGLDVVGAMTQGDGNTASGTDSHAEGCAGVATGDFSHTEGAFAIAEGSAAHGEGSSCYARGDNSHAEGDTTEAGGPGAHAEGVDTFADGNGSHAQGISSYAGNTGQEAWASGCFSDVGDSQVTQTVLRGMTIGTAPGEEIELLLGPEGDEKLIFQDTHTYAIFLECVATSGNDRFCLRQMVLANASTHPIFTWHFNILGIGTQEVLSTGLGVDWALRVASIYVPPSMGHPAGSRFGVLFNTGASQVEVSVVCNVRVVEVAG